MCRCLPRHATPRRLRPMLPASAGLDIAPLGYPGVLGGIRQAPCRTQGPPYWPSCIVRRCNRVRFSGTAGCCATCCAGGTGCGPSSTRSCSSCGRHAADTAAEARACARACDHTHAHARKSTHAHARTYTHRARMQCGMLHASCRGSSRTCGAILWTFEWRSHNSFRCQIGRTAGD